jgi:hypothetical protein
MAAGLRATASTRLADAQPVDLAHQAGADEADTHPRDHHLPPVRRQAIACSGR